MNILTIIVLLLIAVFMLNGYRKGFVKVLTSMVFFILVAVLVSYINPYVSHFLKESTPLYKTVEKKCEENLFKNKTGEDGTKETTSFLDQKKMIEELELPEILKNQLINNNNEEGYKLFDATDFTKYITAYMADIIVNIISYVVTLLLVFVITRVTIMVLNVAASLPGISGANHFLGMVVGLIQGILIVWFAFLIITVIGQTDAGKQLLKMISDSPILNFIYDYNVFLKFLL